MMGSIITVTSYQKLANLCEVLAPEADAAVQRHLTAVASHARREAERLAALPKRQARRSRGNSPQTAEIIRRLRAGEQQRKIAAAFDITTQRVNQIALAAGIKTKAKHLAAIHAKAAAKAEKKAAEVNRRKTERQKRIAAKLRRIKALRTRGVAWKEIFREVGSCYWLALRHIPELREREFAPRRKNAAPVQQNRNTSQRGKSA